MADEDAVGGGWFAGQEAEEGFTEAVAGFDLFEVAGGRVHAVVDVRVGEAIDDRGGVPWAGVEGGLVMLPEV